MHCLMYGLVGGGVDGPMKGNRWRSQRGVLGRELRKKKNHGDPLPDLSSSVSCLHSYQQSPASDIKTDEQKRRHLAPVSSHKKSLDQKKMDSHLRSKTERLTGGSSSCFYSVLCWFANVNVYFFPHARGKIKLCTLGVNINLAEKSSVRGWWGRCSEVLDTEEVNSCCFLCLRASHAYLLRSHLTRWRSVGCVREATFIPLLHWRC